MISKLNTETTEYRTVGEFEPQSSVLIGWPLDQYPTKNKQFDTDKVIVELVNSLIDQTKIIIFSFNDDIQQRAKQKLKEKNIDINKIDFIVYPSDLIFPRDYGVEIIMNDKGEKLLADFDFNFYSILPDDQTTYEKYDAFSQFHSNHLGVKKFIRSKLVSEGGDREFNGKGVMMAIEETEVNKRNPTWKKEEVEAEFKRIFNLKKIIWIPQATYDDENQYSGTIPDENGNFTAYRSASANGHIDEMCRFVNETTILIAYISEEEAQKSKLARLNKERLDKALKVLQQATDANGKPFNIVKIPAPEPIYVNIGPGDPIYEQYQLGNEPLKGKMLDGSPFPTGKMKVLPALSYCNFLICNDVVIAQKYYQEGMPLAVKKKDEEALSVLKSVFPDKKVIALSTIALNLYGGGIHCNTRNAPK